MLAGELLRLAAQLGRPQMVPPHSGTGPGEDGKPAPGNPTNYVILIAPILVDKQVAGLVEVQALANQRIYELRAQPLRQLNSWLERYRRIWAERFDELDELIDELAKKERTDGNRKQK